MTNLSVQFKKRNELKLDRKYADFVSGSNNSTFCLDKCSTNIFFSYKSNLQQRIQESII